MRFDAHTSPATAGEEGRNLRNGGRAPAGASIGAEDLIEIRVAPRADSIATVRAVATDFAARTHLDFDLDTVSDVRMAVDEACTEVMRLADPVGLIRVKFCVDHEVLRVVVRAPTQPDRNGVDTDGFGWRVLGALTDELATDYASGPASDEVIIEFGMKFSDVAPARSTRLRGDAEPSARHGLTHRRSRSPNGILGTRRTARAI